MIKASYPGTPLFIERKTPAECSAMAVTSEYARGICVCTTRTEVLCEPLAVPANRLALYLFWLFLFFFGTSPLMAEEAELIRLSGSTYTGFTAQEVARIYMEQHPQAHVQITQADQHAYIQTLHDLKADIIITFGSMHDDLKREASDAGLQLIEQVVGWGAIVLVVNRDNPVNDLTLEHIRKIFIGEYRNWAQLDGNDEPIQVVSRDEAVSGTETLFSSLVLQETPLAQQTVRLFDRDMCKAVQLRRGSIADARYPEAIRGRIAGLIKLIAVEQDAGSPPIIPSIETIQSRTYPISAPMVAYYTEDTGKPYVADFIGFWAKRGVGSPQQDEK